jgi:hypothetical protein
MCGFKIPDETIAAVPGAKRSAICDVVSASACVLLLMKVCRKRALNVRSGIPQKPGVG